MTTTITHIDKATTAGSARPLPIRLAADPALAAGTAFGPPPQLLGSPGQLREEVARRLERGESLDTIERELIAPSQLPEEHQSALWLYAWSLPHRPPPSQPRLPIWAALGNALLTFVGIYRY
jgi:hypothetical protein